MRQHYLRVERFRAAFEGCYEAPRAAALSGVPLSTVYRWARSGLVEPSVSPKRLKLWSYADLMALRVVYWLRHPKEGPSGPVNASPMASIRDALGRLEQMELDIWDEQLGPPHSPLQVDEQGRCYVIANGTTTLQGQSILSGTLDLLAPFEIGNQNGPDLRQPRPSLRIIPGKVSGEPHIMDSRITTRVISALQNRLNDVQKVTELFPGIAVDKVSEAIEFEKALAA